MLQQYKHAAGCRSAAGVAKGGQKSAKTVMRTATMGKLGGNKNGEGEGDGGGPKMPKASRTPALSLLWVRRRRFWGLSFHVAVSTPRPRMLSRHCIWREQAPSRHMSRSTGLSEHTPLVWDAAIMRAQSVCMTAVQHSSFASAWIRPML